METMLETACFQDLAMQGAVAASGSADEDGHPEESVNPSVLGAADLGDGPRFWVDVVAESDSEDQGVPPYGPLRRTAVMDDPNSGRSTFCDDASAPGSSSDEWTAQGPQSDSESEWEAGEAQDSETQRQGSVPQIAQPNGDLGSLLDLASESDSEGESAPDSEHEGAVGSASSSSN
mmetsp:Transcript_74363/g.170550  ORF Transcript_74363/g.170550 Transcript_74363/m.170550 type:complete len:176 (+) Transcript_74363:114-641(+)